MRTQISKAIMGLACLSMLASCASTVSADEAKKIAGNWKIEEAAKVYTKGSAVTEDNKGNKNTVEYSLESTLGEIAVAALIAASAVAVNAAAIVDGTQFKADGTALEFSYKDDSATYEYKTNAYGLPTYTKTTANDGSWSKATYTWSK